MEKSNSVFMDSGGEEVAVKLIRRAGVDGTMRMGKVEREIEVLRVCPCFPSLLALLNIISIFAIQTLSICTMSSRPINISVSFSNTLQEGSFLIISLHTNI